MRVDGDETETPETTAPLKSKRQDHATEQVSKHRLFGVAVDEQVKWQLFSEMFIFFRNYSKLSAIKQNWPFCLHASCHT